MHEWSKAAAWAPQLAGLRHHRRSVLRMSKEILLARPMPF